MSEEAPNYPPSEVASSSVPGTPNRALQKRQQLKALYEEIISTQGRRSILDLVDDADTVTVMVSLEDGIKSRDKTIDSLNKKVRDLELQIEKKDAGLVRLTTSLDEAAERHKQLEAELATARQEKKLAEEERKATQQTMATTQLALKRTEEALAGKDFTKELNEAYAQVIKLEAEAKAHALENEKLTNENRALEKQLKAKEAALQRLEPDPLIQRAREERELSLENTVSDLRREKADLEKERAILLSTQMIQEQKIEKMLDAMRQNDVLQEELKQAHATIKTREKRLSEIETEKQALERLQERANVELVRIADNKPELQLVRQLENDKRALQAQLRQRTEKEALLEKSNKSQQTRILQLTARIEAAAQAARDLKAANPKSRSSSISGVTPRSTTATAASLLTAEEDQPVDAVTTELPPDSVPGDLFDALQKQVDVLKVQVRDRDTLLSTKDATIETLERKLDIAEKARASTLRRSSMSMSLNLSGVNQSMSQDVSSSPSASRPLTTAGTASARSGATTPSTTARPASARPSSALRGQPARPASAMRASTSTPTTTTSGVTPARPASALRGMETVTKTPTATSTARRSSVGPSLRRPATAPATPTTTSR